MQTNVLFREAVELQARGDWGTALDRCAHALRERPDDPGVLNLMGVLHARLGNADDGVTFVRRAIDLDRHNPEFLVNLGMILRQSGDLGGARTALSTAIRFPHAPIEAFQSLAGLLFEVGDNASALQVLWARVERRPDDHTGWLSFSDALKQVTFTDVADPAPLLRVLRAVLERPGIEHRKVVGPLRQIVWHMPDMIALRDADRAGDHDAFLARLRRAETLDVLTGSAVGLALARMVVPDADWERVWTRVRRALLDVATSPSRLHPMVVEPTLPSLLAQQCWLNGFAWVATDDEMETVEWLRDRVRAPVSLDDPAAMLRLAVLGCYGGLLDQDVAEVAVDLARRRTCPAFVDLLVQQIERPLEERELAEHIPVIGELATEVSVAVREQYEENPYPRWATFDVVEPKPLARALADKLPTADFGELARVRNPKALAAGCGTGWQLALMATTFADTTITGVDLSRASLAYAARACAEGGLSDVSLCQADILALADAEDRFDLISCTGVLHHMEDPFAGWRVLEGLLQPGGVMKIALYSEIARRTVVEAREIIEREGYPPTPEGIRKLRGDILDGRRPSLESLLAFRDFYVLDECRDLLFHVQEHRYTIPRIRDEIDRLGLEFLGFEIDDRTMNRFREAHPEPGAERSLDVWRAFEEAHPDTFVSMYQFWLKKPA